MMKRLSAVLATVIMALAFFASPAAADPPPIYKYAGASQDITVTSLAANMSVEQPYLDTWSSYHTLAELAVIKDVSCGTGCTTRQIVEVGWNVDLALNGDLGTYLFTYAWKDGNGLGYNTLGSGGGSSGFVPYCPAGFGTGGTCSTKQAGGQLIAPSGSTLSSKGFSIVYQSTGSSGWWVAYDGAWFGLWPDSIWPSGSTYGGAFTSGTKVDLFGEIATNGYNTGPCDDMFNGTAASSVSNTVGAFIGSTTVNGSTSGVSLGAYSPDATHWKSRMIDTSTRSFRYTGDGYC